MQTDEIYKEMLGVLEDLQESVSYWSEYDVPVGIVERINSVVEKAKGELAETDDGLEDICLRCGKVIDLTQPHDYSYYLDGPVHRNCDAGE